MGQLQTTTANSQLSTLDEKISSVTDLLTPAREDEIANAVIKLAGSGLAFPPGIDPGNAARVYQFALRGVSYEAIKRTVVKIVQGEVDSVRNFLPTPPALAALCKAEAREIWQDRERLITTKEAMEFHPPGGTKTDEAKAKVRAMVQAVKDSAKAARLAEKDALYDKPEDELNRLFRNKVFPPPEPQAEKWDDEKWHQQQKENDNGEEKSGHEIPADADASGLTEGRGDGSERFQGIYGFDEDGR